MIVRPVSSRSIRANRRLDCKYFLSPGTQAAERLAVAKASGVELRLIGGTDGIAEEVWAPKRFRRAYAAPGEDGVPYLRPYDVFDYVPQAADFLSRFRSSNLRELMAPQGALLQTCSGRNLGPAVAVDAHLAGFALSHDLIRIEVENDEDRHYLMAFLSTPTGQALIRRDKTGSVIDHISVSHLVGVAVPYLSRSIRTAAAQEVARSIQLREKARTTITKAIADLDSATPRVERVHPAKAGWSASARSLGSRVDAAFHDPILEAVRGELSSAGGMPLGDVADTDKPGGRYKTYYVAPEHGTARLSGRQLLQYAPVNLQYLSPRSVDPGRFELRAGWLAIQADGRSEERLGLPVMIEPARDVLSVT